MTLTLLVYKKSLVSPHSGLEIKTLALLNPSDSSGRGLGSLLFERAHTVARQRQATQIMLTVSSNKPEALSFFQKKGFLITGSMPDRYSVGAIEHELSYPVPALKLEVDHKAILSAPIRKRLPSPQDDDFTLDSKSTDYRNEKKRSRDDSEDRPRPTKRESQSSSSSSARSSSGFFNARSAETKHHTCTLRNQYIQDILKGKKTYEGRVKTSLFNAYAIGDRATWTSHQGTVETTITDRREYTSFREMLKDVGYKKMVPEAYSLDNAVSLYNAIPDYAEKAERFGVIALGVTVCEPQAKHDVQHHSAARSYS